jgi:hypothetical protein
MSLTAAMDVLFSVNFAVVFDFMYFRFRPSRAKSIGNVLPNRQNDTHPKFFSRFLEPSLPQRGLKKSAEEFRMGIPALRQYIEATMPVAPLGNGVQICSVYNFQILFADFFSVRRASPNDAGWFGASIGKARYKEEKNIDLMVAFRLFGRPLPIHFALLGRKRK